MIRRLTLALTGCLLFAASPAQAEGSAREFLARIDAGGPSGEMFSQILHAYANGFLWANTHLAREHQTRLFCPPSALAITVGQDVDILRRFIARTPTAADVPAGLALLLAYQATFPCPTT